MKMNNRFIYGILSIVLAAVIAFIAIPAVTSRTSSTCEIVRMKTAVTRGTLITTEDLELVEVGGFNLPDSVARKIEDVAGTYAAADLYPGDYLLPEKVSSVPLSSDLSLNEIPDGMVAISVTTQTLATGLSDKLQGGDIIRLYHYDDNNVLEPVSDIPELRFVKVLSVSDSKGLDVDYTTPPEEDEERQQTATITVLATPEQAMLLTRYENEGILHVALISRGNEKLPSFPASDSREYETMLLHIALRITEKLKSAYPQAVWQWKDTPSLQDILKGGTIRILVENMDTYTHADISFDRFGRIHVEPMVIGSFADTENGTNARPQPGGADEETNPEPSVVDVRVWYELIGQKVLEELITDLNANGHSMLTIRENGDIVVSCQKRKILKATLDSFPEKTYWKELVSILEENELKGKISDDSLQVSWI